MSPSAPMRPPEPMTARSAVGGEEETEKMSGTAHVPPTPPDPTPPASRRQFLLGAAGLASLAVPGAATARRLPRSANAGPDWEQLARNLKGPLLRPGSGAYEEAIKIRNLRFAATRPAGV